MMDERYQYHSRAGLRTTQLGNARENACYESSIILVVGASRRLPLSQSLVACILNVRIGDRGVDS